MGDELLYSNLNSYAALMYDKMVAQGREKWAGYKVHLLKRWFPISRLTIPAYIGTFAMTSPEHKIRWIKDSNAIPFADTWVTPADLARLYLSVKYDKVKRRINTAQWKNFYETHRSMPLWADPIYMEQAYYIDIKSAYWSILRAVGWNLQYTPGRVLGINDDMTVNDFPFPHVKMARNCLVSISADGSKTMQYWTGEKIVYKRGGNKLVNRMLWAFVCDVLNGIAFDCVSAGAVYAFTDGYIVPHTRLEAVSQTLDRWQIPYGIKHQGECEVSGPGAYSFTGGITTRKFNIQRPHTFHKINPVSNDWLRDRFSRAARYNRILEPFSEPDYVTRAVRRNSFKST